MTAVTAPASTETTVQRPSWKSGLLTAVIAAVVTTVVAVIAIAADVPMEIQDEEIPVVGYAQMVLLWSVVGIVLARQLAKRVGHPRHTFVVATVALTVLSFVPSVLADATVATRAVLVLTHVIAAAVVIPRLAADLSD